MLRRAAGLVLLSVVCGGSTARAQIVRVADLNTTEIRALDRAKTVVLLPGGMLEEHGPYLPAYTDGILSERLADELARAAVAGTPGWTVLRFPQLPVGSSGSNELGGQYVFPGTYVVRPSTLRAIYMDLATELGDQGFKWIMVVHVHGAPMHIRALDQAGDYFHDTYGGRMVNLWGLVPVLGGWGKVLGGAERCREERGRRLAARRPGRAQPDAAPEARTRRARLQAGGRGGRADDGRKLQHGEGARLARLSRIAPAGVGRDRQEDLGFICRRGGRAHAGGPQGRRSGSVPALRRPAGEKPALPGMD